jgi:hypothetical protein
MEMFFYGGYAVKQVMLMEWGDFDLVERRPPLFSSLSADFGRADFPAPAGPDWRDRARRFGRAVMSAAKTVTARSRTGDTG